MKTRHASQLRRLLGVLPPMATLVCLLAAGALAAPGVLAVEHTAILTTLPAGDGPGAIPLGAGPDGVFVDSSGLAIDEDGLLYLGARTKIVVLSATGAFSREFPVDGRVGLIRHLAAAAGSVFVAGEQSVSAATPWQPGYLLQRYGTDGALLGEYDRAGEAADRTAPLDTVSRLVAYPDGAIALELVNRGVSYVVLAPPYRAVQAAAGLFRLPSGAFLQALPEIATAGPQQRRALLPMPDGRLMLLQQEDGNGAFALAEAGAAPGSAPHRTVAAAAARVLLSGREWALTPDGCHVLWLEADPLGGRTLVRRATL
ncbi:MAG: hypothetical protein HYV63_03765 [Candidatus Schekmanbacteria bacterium]|nr:hypothetical protein [Candidatus Schekmanbacteria bacterium]